MELFLILTEIFTDSVDALGAYLGALAQSIFLWVFGDLSPSSFMLFGFFVGLFAMHSMMKKRKRMANCFCECDKCGY